MLCRTGANTYSGGNTISGAPALEPVRVREYFPETLYFNPAVITDHQGNALLRVPLADSITTWRLTCMASSARGRLGSATAGINVFQDFFVDIDFPVALTQHDEVSVPVAVYNYLKTDQAVRLEVTPGDWFELRSPAGADGDAWAGGGAGGALPHRRPQDRLPEVHRHRPRGP